MRLHYLAWRLSSFFHAQLSMKFQLLKNKNAEIFLRPNKKNKCVSGNWSENLGRVSTHIFFLNTILCNLKENFAFQNAKKKIPENLKKSRVHQ